MGAPTINAKDLDKETRKAIGVSLPRENAFTAEEVASAALRCLAALPVERLPFASVSGVWRTGRL
jgi:hypothetical protein